MLKSIGMTPGQVLRLVVVSAGVLGTVGGVIGTPVGMLGHTWVLSWTAHASQIDFPASMTHVWNAMEVVLLTVSGLVIAALGALLPARRAAQAPVAEVLRTE